MHFGICMDGFEWAGKDVLKMFGAANPTHGIEMLLLL